MMLETTTARNGRIRAASPAPCATEPTRAYWLLCRAGTMQGALPIEHVVEIMRVLPLERLAGVPPYVLGLSIIRGAAVPVIDIGMIVGGALSRAARLVTVRAATRTIALAVDAVIGVTAIAADCFGQLPPLLQDAAAETISALGTLDAELVVFLRTSRLVPDHVFAQLDATGAAS